MVSKKTSSEASAKTAVKAEETAKKAAAKAVAGSAKTTAKAGKNAKPAAKAAMAKADNAKTMAKKEAKAVPATANRDIAAEVLNIKSANEEKKTAKKSGGSAKSAVAGNAVSEGEPGKKAANNSKRAEVLENAKIAEAKKFLEMKETAPACESACAKKECTGCGGGAFCSWIKAYKNIFNFKGRTSRFEFWSFMLINLFAVVLLAFGVGFLSAFLPTVSLVLTVILYVAEILVYLAIITRRLHDAGYAAWKGFFRPCLFNWIGGMAFMIAAAYLFNEMAESGSGDLTGIKWTGGAAIALFIAYLYYCIKIFIAAGFFEEENGTNAYGAMSAYCDHAHKQRALRYAAIYLLLVLLSNVIQLASYMLGMLGGSVY